MQYSVVIPAHNEAKNLPALLSELEATMSQFAPSWELIIVDDASSDGTWDMLAARQQTMPQLRAIQLRRQSGQSAALAAGFKEIRGEVVITLDGDGQNDPHDIPLLLEALADVDCVTGCRTCRHDSWGKKITSFCANSLRRYLLGDTIQDTGCSLKVFRAPCLASLKMFKGMHRFLPSLVTIEGYRVKEIPVSHRPRKEGASHYSLRNRGLSTIVDLLAVWWMKRRHIRLEIANRLPQESVRQ